MGKRMREAEKRFLESISSDEEMHNSSDGDGENDDDESLSPSPPSKTKAQTDAEITTVDMDIKDHPAPAKLSRMESIRRKRALPLSRKATNFSLPLASKKTKSDGGNNAKTGGATLEEKYDIPNPSRDDKDAIVASEDSTGPTKAEAASQGCQDLQSGATNDITVRKAASEESTQNSNEGKQLRKYKYQQTSLNGKSSKPSSPKKRSPKNDANPSEKKKTPTKVMNDLKAAKYLDSRQGVHISPMAGFQQSVNYMVPISSLMGGIAIQTLPNHSASMVSSSLPAYISAPVPMPVPMELAEKRPILAWREAAIAMAQRSGDPFSGLPKVESATLTTTPIVQYQTSFLNGAKSASAWPLLTDERKSILSASGDGGATTAVQSRIIALPFVPKGFKSSVIVEEPNLGDVLFGKGEFQVA
jgi:hypothetical protein